jgi:hypothetical protein
MDASVLGGGGGGGGGKGGVDRSSSKMKMKTRGLMNRMKTSYESESEVESTKPPTRRVSKL